MQEFDTTFKPTKVELPKVKPTFSEKTARLQVERMGKAHEFDVKKYKQESPSRKLELMSAKVGYAKEGFAIGKLLLIVALTGFIILGGVTGFGVLFTSIQWYYWVGIIFALLIILRRLK